MFLTDEERKLTIQGCRFCPMCYHADTVAGITCKETHSPRGRGLILFGLENGVLKWDDPAVADVLYKSFTDGLPQEWCAGHYDADELRDRCASPSGREGIGAGRGRSGGGPDLGDGESLSGNGVRHG